ncbi:MAG: hypothetical protein ACEY3E_06335 [Candidatus Tisiphia sp.]
MFDFLEVGRGIQVLYEYAKAEILESDFLISKLKIIKNWKNLSETKNGICLI